METSIENWLLILVIVMAVGFLAQALLLLVFFIAFRNWCRRTEAVLQDLNRNAQPLFQAARELVTESRAKVNGIADSVTEILQMTKHQVGRVDGLISEASDRARLQLIRVDQVASDTLR